MRRGQVTIEVVVATIVLLVIMLFIFQQSSLRSAQIDFQKTTGIQKTDCLGLQSAISTVQSVGEDANVRVFVNYDFNTNGNSVDFGGSFCYFPGNPISGNFKAGDLNVVKVKGRVSICQYQSGVYYCRP